MRTLKTPTLVHGTVDRSGNIILRWNAQDTALRAPSGGVYFPCGACGVVHDVPHDVVSFECDTCVAHVNVCEDLECDHPAHRREERRNSIGRHWADINEDLSIEGFALRPSSDET